jgi:hypothetical protein
MTVAEIAPCAALRPTETAITGDNGDSAERCVGDVDLAKHVNAIL